MKFFHFILSSYILLLCSMPCTDVHKDGHKEMESEISGEPCNPHEDETCSPFCICFCCGSLGVDMTALPGIRASSFKFCTVFQPELIKIKKVSFSIWQPPKTA